MAWSKEMHERKKGKMITENEARKKKLKTEKAPKRANNEKPSPASKDISKARAIQGQLVEVTMVQSGLVEVVENNIQRLVR